MRNNSQPLVFMYSGQGSQSYQMGAELYKTNTVFRHWMEAADQQAQHWLHISILNELYNPNNGAATPFDETLFTHPAIFAVQYAMTQVLQSEGICPDIVMGASLGEFGAAAIAGVISFDQALELICLQAQILDTYSAHSGGMLAVLAPINTYESTALIRENTTLAAINTEEHFVISGTMANLRRVERYLGEQRITCQMLPVKHAFHSPLMDSLAPSYMPVLERSLFNPPKIPLVFCSQANHVEIVVADSFWGSIRGPIRILETMGELESRSSYRYLDIGPSGTLANFAKLNCLSTSNSSTLSCMNPFANALDQLNRTISALR